MNDSTTKRCTNCGNAFPATLEWFYSNKTHRDGLDVECRQCARQRQRKYYAAHKAEIAEQNRQYRETHKTEIKARRRDYRQRNLDAIKEKDRRYRQNNKEKKRASDRGYRERTKERQREYHREYRRKHPEQIKANVKRYMERNPHVWLVSIHRRRARKLALPYRFTHRDWQRCLGYWQHHCCICGQAADMWHTLAQDHWIPLSDMRPDNPGTVPENIIPLCHAKRGSQGMPGCNNTKGSQDPTQWLISLLGKKRALKKIAEIETYFRWVSQHNQTPSPT